MKNNIIKFPSKELEKLVDENQSHFVFDFGEFNPEECDKVFDVMNFLSNKEVLLEKFKPHVQKFLSNRPAFTNTSFRIAYNQAFDDFICGLIKDELVDHFNFTPEEIILLTDKEVLDFLSDGYFFDKTIYLHGGKDNG